LKLFPETREERKKFAVIHACTLAVSPLILAIIAGIKGVIFELDIVQWLIGSVLMWSITGSAVQCWGIYGFSGRLIMFALTFIFPFYYLYNLWHIIFRKSS